MRIRISHPRQVGPSGTIYNQQFRVVMPKTELQMFNFFINQTRSTKVPGSYANLYAQTLKHGENFVNRTTRDLFLAFFKVTKKTKDENTMIKVLYEKNYL